MGTVRTFCRICEPSCGMIAEVDDGVIVSLHPDRDHPVTQGFACHKGTAALEVHRDPDRLNTPMLRSADGGWRPTSWDEAMATTAARLRAILDRDGPDAIGAYIGNPSAFNALGSLHMSQLLRALGVRRTFSSGTQDCANKFVASEAVFGSSNVHPIPDLDQTELCLIIGENPRVSQGSFYSAPNLLATLRRAAKRGARIVFVNPRRIETPDRGIGDTVLIRPDTDVWFLASLLTEIDRRGGFDEGLLDRHGRNVDALRAFCARYPADRTASVTGIPAVTVEELADAWIRTPRASVHASTGINMGRQGTLAYWLVHMLSFVTGRLDTDGGNLKSDGFYPNARAGAGLPEQGYVTTEFGTLRKGALPGTLMSHAILDSDRPLRAMIVMSGNPLLSVAGQERLRKAFEQLELVVVIDLYPTATSEFAHVLFPAADMYEREDLNIVNLGTSAVPFAQYTPAVVPPVADRRPEWWIAHRLLRELGLPSLLDEDDPDPWAKYRHMLASGAGIDLADLQVEAEQGGTPIRVLPRPAPGEFYDRQVQTPDGLVDCCPAIFADAIERCEGMFLELLEMSSQPEGESALLLIHRRDPWMHNTWLANLERMARRSGEVSALSMHPDDAASRGLVADDRVMVRSDHGEIAARVDLDPALRHGVVSMVHGGGHTLSPRLRIAASAPGSNPNALLPIGPGSFEPLSSQAHMTGIPVEVEPVAQVAVGASRCT